MRAGWPRKVGSLRRTHGRRDVDASSRDSQCTWPLPGTTGVRERTDECEASEFHALLLVAHRTHNCYYAVYIPYHDETHNTGRDMVEEIQAPYTASP